MGKATNSVGFFFSEKMNDDEGKGVGMHDVGDHRSTLAELSSLLSAITQAHSPQRW